MDRYGYTGRAPRYGLRGGSRRLAGSRYGRVLLKSDYEDEYDDEDEYWDAYEAWEKKLKDAIDEAGFSEAYDKFFGLGRSRKDAKEIHEVIDCLIDGEALGDYTLEDAMDYIAFNVYWSHDGKAKDEVVSRRSRRGCRRLAGSRYGGARLSGARRRVAGCRSIRDREFCGGDCGTFPVYSNRQKAHDNADTVKKYYNFLKKVCAKVKGDRSKEYQRLFGEDASDFVKQKVVDLAAEYAEAADDAYYRLADILDEADRRAQQEKSQESEDGEAAESQQEEQGSGSAEAQSAESEQGEGGEEQVASSLRLSRLLGCPRLC